MVPLRARYRKIPARSTACSVRPCHHYNFERVEREILIERSLLER